MVKTAAIRLESRGNAHIIDITSEVAQAVQGSELADGTATIFCPSATSAVTTIEYEGGVLQDFQRLFDEIVAPDREYRHNFRWGDGNGHSHVRASLLGPSLTVPFVEARLLLGTWQQIVFVDFDIRVRQRQLIVQMIGE